ncbi:GntR family transcriptional regulator [Enterococcus florum]|uniref:GntR family transcriptional regulator n=1 Tax=Enterococcus florum TaxID=2480627 RepID=A0A4P5P9G1_9ENTE|nr:PLP-dependent aminotransferase family protein [Enterococcus florum]GCF94550.1 GntR family transcriptional regulator [Enterococcus florum]
MWFLNKTEKKPIYQQIIEQIVTYIQEGQLQPGERLPSERRLAEAFDVNRSTVVHALDELAALGWVLRKRGSGTIVNETKWGRSAAPRVDWRKMLKPDSYQKDPYLQALQEKTKEKTVMNLFSGELPLNLIPDFRFPSYTWEELLIEERKQTELGYPLLQEVICKRLKSEQDIQVDSSQILITSGAQQALFLLLQVLLENGDTVAIEDPSFLYSLPIFETAGIKVYGVSSDQAGIRIDELEQLILAKRIKLIIVNPTFQNPTGQTMSLKRREELIALSLKYQIPLIEDDVFSELHFKKLPLSLKAISPRQVIHLGSLSKIFGSSIKIGWIVADRALIQRLAEAKQRMDFSISIFPQVIAHTALSDKSFEKNRAHLVQTLKERAEYFENIVDELGSNWTCHPIQGGLYGWLTWKGRTLTRKDWRIFLQKNLLVAPSFLFSNDTMSMRINYTRMSFDEMNDFVKRLKEISICLGGESVE